MARPAARLFAPATAADKLILQRVIKRRSFRPPIYPVKAQTRESTTRFAAAAVVIFMIVGVKFTSAKGFFWTQGGSEYALLIGFCALFFLIRGGGVWSLDRAIGREL